MLAPLRGPTHVLIDRVSSGDVKYEEAVYSLRDCWLTLQIDAVRDTQPYDGVRRCCADGCSGVVRNNSMIGRDFKNLVGEAPRKRETGAVNS